MEKIVIEIDGCIQLEVRDPGLVEKPGQGCVSSEYIVPLLLIFSCEGVRIILRVHSAYVAGKSGFEPEHFPESVAVAESYAGPRV